MHHLLVGVVGQVHLIQVRWKLQREGRDGEGGHKFKNIIIIMKIISEVKQNNTDNDTEPCLEKSGCVMHY